MASVRTWGAQSSRTRRSVLYRWIVLGLLAAAVPATAQTVTTSPAVRTSHPHRFRVDGHRFSGKGCSARTVVPRIAYDLGARFEGLARNPRDYRCFPAPKDPSEVTSGPLVSAAYVSIVYGTCDSSKGPCAPPLEIQNAPECARNPNSYRPNPGQTGEPGEGVFSRKERMAMNAAPWIPVLRLEGGNRIELFAGRTTVVVFATEYGRTKRAANVLARAIAEREDPTSSARRLRADANQPGDGAACRTFRGVL
jgi:hypothetical protein